MKITCDEPNNTITVHFTAPFNYATQSALYDLTKREHQSFLFGSWEYLAILEKKAGNDPLLSETIKRLQKLEETFLAERDEIIACKPAWAAICHDMHMLDEHVSELTILYLLLIDSQEFGSELRFWAAARMLGFPFRIHDVENFIQFVEVVKKINYSDWLANLEAESAPEEQPK